MKAPAGILSVIMIVMLALSGASVAQQFGVIRKGDGTLMPYIPHLIPADTRPSPKAVPTKPSDQIFESVTNEEILRGLSLAFVILASCTLILFVLGCGSRVVVFADASDVLMSASILLAPVVTALATIALILLFTPDHHGPYGGFWQAVKGNPAPAFAIGVGALWWAWATLGTLVSSIHHNGFIVGTVVAVLKVGAVFSLLGIWYGMVLNEAETMNGMKARFFLFVILAWFASKFVNGGRVMERRERMMRGSGGTLVQA